MNSASLSFGAGRDAQVFPATGRRRNTLRRPAQTLLWRRHCSPDGTRYHQRTLTPRTIHPLTRLGQSA
jgi:hypothetical protein